MKRLLVTGAGGFIGRHLLQALEYLDYEVFTLSSKLIGERNCTSDIGSVQTREFIERVSPNTLIHLAGCMDVRQSHTQSIDFHKVNTGGTLNVLSALKSVSNAEFIYLNSGGAIYDCNENLPLNEKSRLGPISPYGISKMAAEYYTAVICKSSGINWTSLAVSNCYGDFATSTSGVMWNFYDKIRNNEKALIFGNQTSRDFIYIDDVVNAILMTIDNPTFQRVNISSNIESKLSFVYSEIATKLRMESNFEIVNALENEVSRSQLDNSLALQLLGWFPKISVEDGIGLSIGGQ